MVKTLEGIVNVSVQELSLPLHNWSMCHMGKTIRHLSLLKVCALTTVGDGMVKGLLRIIRCNEPCA